MRCDEIRKRLQAFLSDLLSDSEYRAFVAHVEECARCREYVRAIGDLSNQVWKLGKVRVPGDFAQTVIFKMKEGRSQAPEPGHASSRAKAPAVLFLIVATAFLALFFYGRSSRPAPGKIASKPTAVKPAAEESTDDFFNDTRPAQPAAMRMAFNLSQASQPSAEKPPAVMPDSRLPLHWHLAYASEKRKRLEALQQQVAALRRIQVEIEHFGKREPTEDRELRLKELNGQAEEVKSQVQRLENESKTEPLKREQQRQLSDMLMGLGIRLQSESQNLLVFTARKGEIAKAMETIFSREMGSLEDFTRGASKSENAEERVSIYLDGEGESDLHWHVGPLNGRQKTDLLSALREMGGSISQDYGDLIFLSISQTKIKPFKARLQALRISFSEFGHPDLQGDVLGDVPVAASIYFT